MVKRFNTFENNSITSCLPRPWFTFWGLFFPDTHDVAHASMLLMRSCVLIGGDLALAVVLRHLATARLFDLVIVLVRVSKIS